MQHFYTYYDSPAGTLLLTSNGKQITGMHWKVFKRAPKPTGEWIEGVGHFKQIISELDEYFASKRQVFNVSFKAETGTDFQKCVWQELATIPFGQTRTYGDIAKAIGKPAAVRAVGHAVGSNPISIAVPCHRVLAAGNRVNGYAGGIEAKAVLLKHEGIAYND